jgi:hypothetical protein
MTAARIELSLILAASAAWLFLAPTQWQAPVGEIVGDGAALLLAQGLVRDLVRLAWKRRQSGTTRRILCLCAESSVGLTLIVLALAAVFLGIDQRLVVSHAALQVTPVLILAAGFVLKDYVLVIRRETDHGNVVL